MGEDGKFITSHIVDNLVKYTGIVLTEEEGIQLNARLMNARGKVYKKIKLHGNLVALSQKDIILVSLITKSVV